MVTQKLLLTKAKEIFSECEKILVDRGETYANKHNYLRNLDKMAEIWSEVMNRPVTREEVLLCMIGMKWDRLQHSVKQKKPKEKVRDNIVDIINYAIILWTVYSGVKSPFTLPADYPYGGREK